MAATISPKQVAEVFWGSEQGNDADFEDTKEAVGRTRESMYVTTFEGEFFSYLFKRQRLIRSLEMLNTVLDHESFLFSSEELDVFSRYKTMTCSRLPIILLAFMS